MLLVLLLTGGALALNGFWERAPRETPTNPAPVVAAAQEAERALRGGEWEAAEQVAQRGLSAARQILSPYSQADRSARETAGSQLPALMAWAMLASAHRDPHSAGSFEPPWEAYGPMTGRRVAAEEVFKVLAPLLLDPADPLHDLARRLLVRLAGGRVGESGALHGVLRGLKSLKEHVGEVLVALVPMLVEGAFQPGGHPVAQAFCEALPTLDEAGRRSAGDHLFALASDPQRPPRERMMAAELLAAAADVPLSCRHAGGWFEDDEQDIPRILDAWERMRALAREPAARERVAVAMEELGRQTWGSSWRSEVVGRWLAEHTGQAPAFNHHYPDWRPWTSWWAAHADTSPKVWFVTALGITGDESLGVLVGALPKLDARERRWMHELLVLLAPESTQVPGYEELAQHVFDWSRALKGQAESVSRTRVLQALLLFEGGDPEPTVLWQDDRPLSLMEETVVEAEGEIVPRRRTLPWSVDGTWSAPGPRAAWGVPYARSTSAGSFRIEVTLAPAAGDGNVAASAIVRLRRSPPGDPFFDRPFGVDWNPPRTFETEQFLTPASDRVSGFDLPSHGDPKRSRIHAAHSRLKGLLASSPHHGSSGAVGAWDDRYECDLVYVARLATGSAADAGTAGPFWRRDLAARSDVGTTSARALPRSIRGYLEPAAVGPPEERWGSQHLVRHAVAVTAEAPEAARQGLLILSQEERQPLGPALLGTLDRAAAAGRIALPDEVDALVRRARLLAWGMLLVACVLLGLGLVLGIRVQRQGASQTPRAAMSLLVVGLALSGLHLELWRHVIPTQSLGLLLAFAGAQHLARGMTGRMPGLFASSLAVAAILQALSAIGLWPWVTAPASAWAVVPALGCLPFLALRLAARNPRERASSLALWGAIVCLLALPIFTLGTSAPELWNAVWLATVLLWLVIAAWRAPKPVQAA